MVRGVGTWSWYVVRGVGTWSWYVVCGVGMHACDIVYWVDTLTAKKCSTRRLYIETERLCSTLLRLLVKKCLYDEDRVHVTPCTNKWQRVTLLLDFARSHLCIL